ncbi:MAG: hypothetical protein ACD_22C00205G0007 [uncultured bacterium]|nr:MAG: hypothetical protein ACD_22C00205G0007 [uncultured bacterium]
MSTWSTKKFSEITEFIQGGGTPSTNDISYWNGNVSWLTPAEITNHPDMYISDTKRHITENGVANSSAKVFEPNTVLMASRATIGTVVLNSLPMATNQGFINIKPKEELNPEFLYFWINANRNFLESQGTGSTFREISKGIFKNLEISYPKKETQNSVVYILKTIKSKINTLNKNIQQYKQLKQSLMEKLFYSVTDLPNGWEVKKAGEVVDIVKKSKVITGDSPIPFIPMSLIADDSLYCRNFEMKRKDNIASGTYFENKSLLVSKITPCFENGKQGIADIPNEYGITSTEIIPLKSKSNTFNIKYLHYLLIEKNRRVYLASTMEGTTGRQRLKTNVLLDLLIPVAPLEEQNRIIDLLEGIDQKVDLIKGKLTLYNNLFNSLLHKLMNQEIDVSNLEFENA